MNLAILHSTAIFIGMDDIEKALVEGFQFKNAFLPEKALLSFKQAASLDPSDGYLLVEIAKCHVDLLENNQASDALKAALELATGDDELILEIARTWTSMGNSNQSLEIYNLVGKKSAVHTQSVLEKVMLLERTHQLDSAAKLLDSDEIQQRAPEIQFCQALIAEREGDILRAERILRKIRKASPKTGFDYEVGYRLARLLERKGKHRDAMQILASSKQSERNSMPVDSVEAFTTQRRASDLEFIETLPADWFSDRPSVLGSDHLLLLGHPRSATSLMAKKLVEKSDALWMDELPCYEVLARSLTREIEQQGIPQLIKFIQSLTREEVGDFQSSYRKKLTKGHLASSSAPVIDKNPGLSCSLPSLHKLLPQSAWLIMLRDPRDVALSCYYQRFGTTSLGVSSLSLEGAFQAVCHALRLWLLVKKNLTPDQFVEVRYESLAEFPGETIRSVCDQLGWTSRDKVPAQNKFLNLTPSYQSIEQPVNQSAVQKWKHYKVNWQAIVPGLNDLLEEAGYELA